MNLKKCIATVALSFVMVVCLAVIFGLVAATTFHEIIRYRIEQLSSDAWRTLYYQEVEKFNALEGWAILGVFEDPEIKEIERLLDEHYLEEQRKAAEVDDSEIPESVRPGGGKMVIVSSAKKRPRNVLLDIMPEAQGELK